MDRYTRIYGGRVGAAVGVPALEGHRFLVFLASSHDMAKMTPETPLLTSKLVISTGCSKYEGSSYSHHTRKPITYAP
jgi:hypothetical protein